MASKIDTVIDRLQEINTEILKLKRSITLLAPLPAPLKSATRQGQEVLDPIIQELYFDALRGAVDIGRMPEVQEASLDAIRSLAQPPSIRKPRSRAQKRNDKMQSQAFKNANAKLRTKAGKLRKGITQADVAKKAQKELKLMKRGTRPKRKSPSGGTRKRGRSGGGRR